YLHEASGQEFTAKDFRTWEGTVLAWLCFQDCDESGSVSEAKKQVTQVIQAVAERLGNTPAICRKCYIHPSVIDGYIEGLMKTGAAGNGHPTIDTLASNASGDLLPEE